MNFIEVSAVAAAMALICISPGARAQGAPTCVRVTRSNVVACALDASLAVKGERQEWEAAEARTTAASPLLPSNPLLALSAGKRTSRSAEATNWYATLSQEIEIAGQRGARRDAAEAMADAQSKRVLLSRREAAASALASYFEVLAAREEQRLADRLTVATRALATVARARAEQGLVAPVDADVAEAATLRVFQGKLAADRRAARELGLLATVLGRDPEDPSLSVEGELEPIPVDAAFASDVAKTLERRPEISALQAESHAQERRADAYRRSRLPNPTLSVFAQNDGFDEHVFGAGLALPIPLPGNVGRTFVGEIAEAEALARRTQTERDRVAREIRFEVSTAVRTFASRTEEVRAFSSDQLARAEESLISLGQEVEAGRLAVRDAVVAQGALIDLLRANVEARRAWCLASVDLARAVGAPLEGRTP